MQQGPGGGADPRPCTLGQFPVERTGLGLLLPAAFMLGTPLGVPRGDVLRRGEVEEVHVGAGHRAVQLVEPAARHHDQALAGHAVRILEPAQERDPVQHLVPHLGQPRPDHDRTGARGHLRDPPIDRLGLVSERLVLPLASAAARVPHQRLVSRLEPPGGLRAEIAERVTGAHD